MHNCVAALLSQQQMPIDSNAYSVSPGTKYRGIKLTIGNLKQEDSLKNYVRHQLF